MGQAKIKRNRQRAEDKKGKADASIRPAILIPPSEPAAITINTDGISDEQKKTEKFKSAYRDMMNQLIAPGFIPVLCAHEAGHAIYFSAAGVKDFVALPPRLEFDPSIDDYKGHLAAYKPLDIPSWVEGDFWNWLYRVSKGYAAGGVIARKLDPRTDGGDANDRDNFEKLCKEINDLDSNMSIDWKKHWKEAQDSVASEIANQEFVKRIQMVAEELRPQFGL
jgi:hypothetical protein